MPAKRSPLTLAGLAVLVLVVLGLTQAGQAALIGVGLFALVLVPLGFLAGALLKRLS